MARFGHLATRRAEAVLAEHGINSIPIDPITLARSKGIEVEPKKARDGVSGLLLRIPNAAGDKFIIGYATHIRNEGFKRFAISHELGHYFLEGHPERVLGASGIHESRAGFVARERHEIEADHFAAGLLMPRGPFSQRLARLQPGLVAVESLSNDFDTSLTATAIRYAQLADEAVAAVVSEGPRVLYCFMSEALETARDVRWLRKGDTLPVGSASEKLNLDPERVSRCDRLDASSRLRDWFGDGPDVNMTEEVLGLGSYGKTLTLLVAEEWPDEEEEDGEVASEWAPTFHRSRRR